MVLMEAMSYGLPVVATRIGGISELVQDDVSGAVIDAGRTDLLVAAMARLAGDADLRRRWGEAGRERVRRDYDIGASSRTLARLFGLRQEEPVMVVTPRDDAAHNTDKLR